MRSVKIITKKFLKRVRSTFQSTWMSYPKNVQCNICLWEGRHFLSDTWHDGVNCPRCRSSIRQRLFVAAFQKEGLFSTEKIIHGKRILHFAPEEVIAPILRNGSESYATTDFLRQDCDFSLDLSNMPEIKDESYDVVIAFDVLEHVSDYQKALAEVFRVLSPEGFGIFTVPQKDNLPVTYEDSNITTPEDRTFYFGQWDHLRVFGDDFAKNVESKGFGVVVVNEATFSEGMVRRHVLFPPVLSTHPLATNYRKVFFCQKNA